MRITLTRRALRGAILLGVVGALGASPARAQDYSARIGIVNPYNDTASYRYYKLSPEQEIAVRKAQYQRDVQYLAAVKGVFAGALADYQADLGQLRNQSAIYNARLAAARLLRESTTFDEFRDKVTTIPWPPGTADNYRSLFDGDGSIISSRVNDEFASLRQERANLQTNNDRVQAKRDAIAGYAANINSYAAGAQRNRQQYNNALENYRAHAQRNQTAGDNRSSGRSGPPDPLVWGSGDHR